MHFSQAISLALVGAASAAPHTDKLSARQAGAAAFLKDHPFVPAAQMLGASRSPCPLLNTLANHGFLPRDGRNITGEAFAQGISDAINISPAVGTTLASLAFTKLGITGDKASISLQQLDAHGILEHDASLFHLNKNQGNTITVQPKLVQDILADTVPADYPYLNTSSLARSRIRLEAASVKSGNPKLSDVDSATAQGESGLLVMIMGQGPEGNVDERKVDKKWLSAWLAQEKFPVELGWTKSAKVFEMVDLMAYTGSVKQWQDKYRNEAPAV